MHRRIGELLQQELRQAGVSKIESKLSLSEGYFRLRRHRGSTPLGTLLAALLEMGVEPGGFFARVFGRGPAEPRSQSILTADGDLDVNALSSPALKRAVRRWLDETAKGDE